MSLKMHSGSIATRSQWAARPWRRAIPVMLPAIACALVGSMAAQAPQPAPAQSGQNQVVLVDLNGGRHTLGVIPASRTNPRVSPDGKRVAFDGENSIWIAELSSVSLMRRLTTGGNQTSWPIWNGEGTRIIFTSDRVGGERAFFSMRADGTGEPEMLVKPVRAPESWPSPTSTWFSYITIKDGEGGDYDIWTYSLEDKKATPVIDTTPSTQLGGRFSPDGRWLAYMSNETDHTASARQFGQFEVWVEPFPRTGARFQITKQGGARPLWSSDGRQLLYDYGGRMFSVAVRTQPTFTFSEPVALPISGFIQGALRRNYDSMPDGKQFLMLFRTAS